MANIQLTTHELWIDGRSMAVAVNKLDSTTLRVTWNIPATPQAYNGFVVMLSEETFSASNFPVDGTKYLASNNWAAPADTIDHAHIIAAAYGFFGDNVATNLSVDVSNVDPNKVYYASIHAASNVLQYYTIGTQSYPLESSRFEKSSDSYAGSIPTSVVVPKNPTNGQAYFDPVTNQVMVWNDNLTAWVQSNQKTVPIGQREPISKKQLFFNSIDLNLKYFSGGIWNNCSALNTRVKLGPTWVPFNSIVLASAYPLSPIAGDFIYLTKKQQQSAPPTFELSVFTMGSWFIVTPDLIQVLTGPAVWENIVIGDTYANQFDPLIPSIGDFFYNSSAKDLVVWDGSVWVKADTAEEGAPTSDKIGIGTDGSYDERLRLMKILKHQMGYPQVCVELSEEQFNIAIDNALDEFRRRADNAYSHRHISFTIVRGQSTYYLNDPRDKTDKIVDIIKIHRVNMLGISSLSSENGLYAQAFFNQLFQTQNVDLLSIHLMAQLSETFEKIFAGNLVFTWDEASRQLMILRRINTDEERVVLEVVMERTEQELLLDRWAKQWLQGWAMSELMEMLGMIRTKYGNLPGPNGGITMNGDTLLSMATEQQNELLRQITDFEVGNGGLQFGNASVLIG
jgi:hypothetical protein